MRISRTHCGSLNPSTGFQAYYAVASVKGPLGDRAASPAPVPCPSSRAEPMTPAAATAPRHSREQISGGCEFPLPEHRTVCSAVGKNGGDSKVNWVAEVEDRSLTVAVGANC